MFSVGKDYIESMGARRHESLVSFWRMLQYGRVILCLLPFPRTDFFFLIM